MAYIEQINVGGTSYDIVDSSNIATLEETNTASKAYSKGEYLIYDGKLFITTANIANGATLTAGTNISETSVGAEFVSLKNDKVSGVKGQVANITNTSTYDMIANGFFSGGHAYFVVLMQTSYVTTDAVSIYGVRLAGTLNAAISEVVLGSSTRAPRLVLDGTKIYLRTNGDTNNINMGYIIYEMA